MGVLLYDRKVQTADNLDLEPLARNYHSSIVRESDMIIFGGYNGTNNLDDLWV